MLWDAGFEELTSIEDTLSRARLSQAREVLGVPSVRDLTSRGYWEERLGIDAPQFERYLRDLGFELSPQASKLPQGALQALRRELERDPEVAVQAAQVAARQQAAAAAKEPVSAPEPSEPPPPLEWKKVGWDKDVAHLSAQDVIYIHDRLVRDALRSNDPISPPGVRSHPLLESAVGRPQTSLGSAEKYPTVEMAAAALMHSLVHNHPFHNGNKRTALVATVAMLDRNNLIFTASEDELFRFMLRVAQHRLVDRTWDELHDREVQEIAEWIRAHSRQLARDERPLKWRELKQILRRYNCVFDTPRTGNRINITRTVDRPGRFLRRSRSEELTVQVHYPDDGREVTRGTVHAIRRELELDEEHDVDSEVFYAEAEIDDFIARYRRILRELAKL